MIVTCRTCGEKVEGLLDYENHMRAHEWLAELFRDEYCAECGGDAEHHTAVPFMGNPFARCDFPYEESGYHPVIADFRARLGL